MNRGSWQLIAEATLLFDGIGGVSLAAGSWGVDEDSVTFAGGGSVDLRLAAFAAGLAVAPQEFVEVHVEGSAWSSAGDTGIPYWLTLVRTGFGPPNENLFRLTALSLQAGVVAEGLLVERMHFRAFRRAPG